MYVLALLLLSDFHHSTSNDWASERCSEKVYVLQVESKHKRVSISQRLSYLVDRVCLESWVDELSDELALEILQCEDGQ